MDDLTARSPRRGEWQDHAQVWGSGTRTGMRKMVMSFLGGMLHPANGLVSEVF